jgi:hypothetical protein
VFLVYGANYAIAWVLRSNRFGNPKRLRDICWNVPLKKSFILFHCFGESEDNCQLQI